MHKGREQPSVLLSVLCIKERDSITIHRTEHKGSYKLQHDIQNFLSSHTFIQFSFNLIKNLVKNKKKYIQSTIELALI